MLYISCFSGIEAASVAVKKAGLSWEPVAFSEIDQFASAVLAHHYPQVPNLGDITKINWEKYARTIGLVCGGSPCQAFSVAGLRKSLEDPRGNLTLEYMRAVHQIKPRWVVWEQVPGVMSASGNPLGCFMAGLAGYDSQITPPGGRWGSVGFLPAKNEQSYSIAYRILDAQHFGVPQRRRRIFLVGHIGTRDWWKPLEVLFERDSEGRDFAPGRKAGEEVAGNAGGGIEGVNDGYMHTVGALCASDYKGVGSQYVGDGKCLTLPMVMAHGQGGAEILEGQSPTLTFNHEAPMLFEHHMQDSRVKGQLKVCPQLNAKAGTGGGNLPLVQHAIAFNWQSGGDCRLQPSNDMANTVHRCQTQAVSFAKNQEGELRTSDTMNTLGTTGNARALSTGKVAQGAIVRRITPTETERLQGFPDGNTRIPYRNKPAELCPDGPRYKALGNSWAVPVAQWVFERIDKVDKLYNAQTV